MELVNNKYVKKTKHDIFLQMVNAGSSEEDYDEEKVRFFQNLLNVAMSYENSFKHSAPIDYFYVSTDYIDKNDTTISRQIIINAIVYATIHQDFRMIKKLIPYLYSEKYIYSPNDQLLEYILENGMDIDEYIDGEKTKLIYNPSINEFEKGFIYGKERKLERKK